MQFYLKSIPVRNKQAHLKIDPAHLKIDPEVHVSIRYILAHATYPYPYGSILLSNPQHRGFGFRAICRTLVFVGLFLGFHVSLRERTG